MGVDRSTSPDEVGGQSDDLVDLPLQQEIELVGALVAAVSAHRGALTQDEIDKLLGVATAEPSSEASSEPSPGPGEGSSDAS